ncbi:MAG: RelA/SpoT domain-containing protein [Phycisphaerales bacterium]
MPPNSEIEPLISVVQSKLHLFRTYQTAVESVFREDPLLRTVPPTVHSIRTRIKDLGHLRDKLARKHADGDEITDANIFQKITDIAGVRVLHLYQQQFPLIHQCISGQLTRGDWVLHGDPTAYTWDPESRAFFEGFGLAVKVKESFYTSIHYVVKPRQDSEVTCEIQVRTLFEEIWGEIDHAINYPHPASSLSCCEQLRVLARLVGAGSRLADSIFRIHAAENRPEVSPDAEAVGTAFTAETQDSPTGDEGTSRATS